MKDNTQTRRVECGTFQREMPGRRTPPQAVVYKIRLRCWKHLTAEAFENYLRVTPIRSGDSVIISEKWFFAKANSKKGGTAAKSLARPL